MMKSQLFILFFLFLIKITIGQPQWEVYNSLSLSNPKGPLDNEVYDMATDNQGRTWLACRSGLSCFDGTQWKNYPQLPNIYLNFSVACDSNGAVWTGSPLSVLGFYKFENGQYQFMDNTFLAISMEVDAQNRLWIAHFDGVIMYENDIKTVYDFVDSLGHGQSPHITLGLDGKVWYGYNTGLYCFNDTAWTKKDTTDGLPSNLVYELETAPDGAIWGMTPNGLFRMDKDTIKTFPQVDEAIYEKVTELYADQNNQLWVATTDMGLYGLRGEEVVHYPPDNKFIYPEIWLRALGKAPNGDLLIGQEGISLNRFDGQNFSYIIGEDMMRATDLAFDNQDNLVAVNGHGGLNIYDGNTWTNHSPANGFISNILTNIAINSKGHFWIGSEKGLIYRNDTGYIYYLAEDGYPMKHCHHVYCDPDNQVWVSDYFHRLIRFDGINSLVLEQEDLGQLHFINAMATMENGNLWIVGQTSDNKGMVCEYNGERIELIKEFPQNLVPTDILYDSKDNTWLSLFAGANDQNRPTIWRYHPSSGWKEFNFTYGYSDTRPDGRTNGSVFSIYEDTFGDIWFGVEVGAVKYSYADSSFTSYSEREGLVADCGSNVHDFAEDEHGNLYFATFEDGIYKMLRPSGVRNGKIVPVGLRAWPNPAHEFLQVDIPGHGLANITLTNMQGQQVLTRQAIGKTTVNVAQLPKGVYLLTVQQNGRVESKKIVVE